MRRLAELLLPANLATRVPAGTVIVVVAHGAIGLVPFAALEPARLVSAAPANGRSARTAVTPLGIRNPIRYAPSFAALRASAQRARVVAMMPRARGAAPQWSAVRASGQADKPVLLAQALVVGNPTMPKIYSGRWTTRSQLRSLPGAEAESRTVATALGATPLIGSEATESIVRSRMSAAPVIHFATHGLAYGTSSSARRSYLAFAPDSTRDGLLTLGELMDDATLVLHAELVVLSACQTGLGDLTRAEGTIGMQRAFLAKGARSVLVSLWSVDDEATRLLMERFYRHWLDPIAPRSKVEALRLAQAEVRAMPKFASPKFWAAFQLVGAE
jgi:CHAT domain-containing protein